MLMVTRAPISVPIIPSTDGQRCMFSGSRMGKVMDIALLTSRELKASKDWYLIRL